MGEKSKFETGRLIQGSADHYERLKLTLAPGGKERVQREKAPIPSPKDL